MKNLIFVIESLHIGGAEKSLISLLQNLDYNNYNVTLVTFIPDGYFRELVPAHVKTIQLRYPEFSLLDRVKFAFQRKTKSNYHSAQLYWSIAKDKFNTLDVTYDVAIAYNQGFATYFTNKYIKAAKKLAWLNTDYTKAGYNIGFDFPIYKNFEAVVAVSPEAKIGLENQLQRIAKTLPITVIKDISDPKVIKEQAKEPIPKPFDENRINIVSVGRLASYKGFPMAVEACKLLLQRGHLITWYLIGEGSERKKLELQIENLGIQENFILVGADTNPYRYVARAAIYVQTSLFEGLGLTVIEAALLCKPIVSTNFPSVQGILEDEKTGLIVPMNPNDIATGIERLINNKDLNAKLVQNLSLQENKSKEQTLSQVELLLNN